MGERIVIPGRQCGKTLAAKMSQKAASLTIIPVPLWPNTTDASDALDDDLRRYGFCAELLNPDGSRERIPPERFEPSIRGDE